jgi:hypothetical protein
MSEKIDGYAVTLGEGIHHATLRDTRGTNATTTKPPYVVQAYITPAFTPSRSFLYDVGCAHGDNDDKQGLTVEHVASTASVTSLELTYGNDQTEPVDLERVRRMASTCIGWLLDELDYIESHSRSGTIEQI